MTIMDLLEHVASILENLSRSHPDSTSTSTALEQLQNVMHLLANGYSVNTSLYELIRRYGSIDSVPLRYPSNMPTILDILSFAERNFNNPLQSIREHALAEYLTANELLRKGYPLNTNVDELIRRHGGLNSIPPKQEHDAQC